MNTNTKENVKTSTKIEVKRDVKITTPRMYQVVLHNNDYTAFEIVTEVILKVFNKGMQEAQNIMMTAHMQGVAVCGMYPKEMAEAKVKEAHEMRDKLAIDYPGASAEELEFSCELAPGQ